MPGKQFKDAKTIQQKINIANALIEWLNIQKEQGLHLYGFCLTHTQLSAATYGLDLIEELPNVHVEPHYNSYRLYFGNHHIDFAQAVALEYYLFAAIFGMLRPSLTLRKSNIEGSLVLYMDRFPGVSVGKLEKGESIPRTDGIKFIEYVISNSETYREIIKDHEAHNVQTCFKTLDFWRPLVGDQKPLEGKTHPHFLLPDWMAVASIATEYRGEFIASFSSHAKAIQLADSCEELYRAFKQFDIWSMDDKTLSHIKGSKSLWKVADEARSYILNRASR